MPSSKAFGPRIIALCSILVLATLTGCASYAPPGRGADLAALGLTPAARQALTEPGLQTAFDKKPLASFPANIAVVRLQAPNYRSETAQGWGTGNYSIVTTRDVETDEQFARIQKLDQIRGLAMINRMLLPAKLETDAELRQAAAKLQCDMLLVYTFDTTFHLQNQAGPVSLITLGFAPVEKASAVTTVSAVLMDTRNGYIYGTAEATKTSDHHTTSWTTDSAIDSARQETEKEAFAALVGEFEKTWKQVASRNTAASIQTPVPLR